MLFVVPVGIEQVLADVCSRLEFAHNSMCEFVEIAGASFSLPLSASPSLSPLGKNNRTTVVVGHFYLTM